MAHSRRRSSRLRGETPESRKITPVTAAKLSSLLERDETPDLGPQSNLDAIVSSPAQFDTAPNTPLSPPVRTPNSTIRHQLPPPEELHPSRYQNHTAKNPGLDVFSAGLEPQTEPPRAKRDISMGPDSPVRQSKSTAAREPFSSPGFEFRFKRPSSELSNEAQRLMGEVREQAARIKHELAVQQAEQKRRDDEAELLYGVGGRKIAKAKGKVGRFSDVHMEEFRKMDSIANHPSKFRADPARAAIPVTNNLKRKADIEGTEPSLLKRMGSRPALRENEGLLARSKSVKSLPREFEEGGASPSKRVRHNPAQETSTVRPIAGNTHANGTKLCNLIRSNSGLPNLPIHNSIATPTKASLARSASVKSLKTTSMIPSLIHSPSIKTLNSPLKTAKTEASRKYRNSLAKFANLKGILRRPQPLFSDDPVKVAAGTHFATPDATSNLNKDLPDLPSTDTPSSEKKRVNFTNSTISKDEQAAVLKASRPSHVFAPGTPTITYPSLPSPRKLPAELDVLNSPSPMRVRASMPGDFTFRADKEINFGPATVGRVSPPKSTIFQVRRSDAGALLGAVARGEHGLGGVDLGKELPCVPHGLPNKKRRYSTVAEVEEEESDEGKENWDHEQDGERAQKKVKSSATLSGAGLARQEQRKEGLGSRIPKKKSGARGVLSLSRLNALARPKERR